MSSKNRPTRWPERPIGDLLTAVIDYRGKTPPKAAEGIPTLTAANVRNGRLDLSKVSYVSKQTYGKWITRGLPEPGDVLITTEAPVGEVASLPRDQTYLITRRLIALRGAPGLLDNNFLKYSLLYEGNRRKLMSLIRGSTVPRVLKPDILGLEIPIPPFDEQLEISSVLKTLDDKIELDRQMNETLEGIARAIFKSWFVDFDPVWAKVEGWDYPLDDETMALFPGRFEDSELGEIPAGWEIKKLADVIDIISGGTPRTVIQEYWNGDIPWFSVKDAPSETDVFVIDTEKKISNDGVNNSATKILPLRTTIISARGTVGKLALTGIPMAMNQSCYGIKGLEPYSDYFIYFNLKSVVTRLKQITHGSVFDTITRDTFSNIKITLPLSELSSSFENRITPIMELTRSNLFQSKTLAKIRDTLLPKLISGELRVPLETVEEARGDD